MQIFVSYHSIQFKTSFCELLFALCQRGVHLSVWEIRKAAVLGGKCRTRLLSHFLNSLYPQSHEQAPLCPAPSPTHRPAHSKSFVCESGTESKRPLGQDRGGDEMDKDYE